LVNEILTERRGAVLWITFNRPEARNAMTLAMYGRLHGLCGEIEADAELRAVVLVGAGGQAFVSGTDIAEFEAFESGDDALRYESLMDEVFSALENLRIPTIAALRGACTGGGAGHRGRLRSADRRPVITLRVPGGADAWKLPLRSQLRTRGRAGR
jgi:enoyl-CoA hydratase